MLKKILYIGLTLIIALSCLGFATGCKEIKSNVEEGSSMVELNTWFFTSGVPNNVIKVKHENSNAIFEIKVYNGHIFGIGAGFTRTTTLKVGEETSWQVIIEQSVDMDYVDIVVKVNKNIIGYVVIKINRVGDSWLNYTPTILKSVTFPKVNGRYQKVTEEYVQQQIKQVKI